MALTDEQVEHIATLARLGLDAEERARLREQLSSILDIMEQLRDIETADISPTAQIIPLAPVLRADVVQPSLPIEQVLANAPRSEGGFIKVNAVLDNQ